MLSGTQVHPPLAVLMREEEGGASGVRRRPQTLHRELTLRSPVRVDLCKCGYSKTDHADDAIKPEDFTGESWDRHRHIREVPTDAFGDISFGSSGQRSGKVGASLTPPARSRMYRSVFTLPSVCSQYARVSSDTRPDILYQLLTDQWELSPPNLLISVTGGAKNFYLKTQLKRMFHRGLIKVAQTTGQREPARRRGGPTVSQRSPRNRLFQDGMWSSGEPLPDPESSSRRSRTRGGAYGALHASSSGSSIPHGHTETTLQLTGGTASKYIAGKIFQIVFVVNSLIEMVL